MKYIPIIGMEVHLQLTTKSKMFCACPNDGETQPPNTTICPICVGHPGTLPVMNKKAIEYTILAALALNCEVNEFSKFDRKNYFYPDLPKAYQISQYDLPIGREGFLDIDTPAGVKKIGITRIHLEEDTAKSTHSGKDSLIDFNRSSSPLVELVTEPDIRDANDARLFCQELQKIFRYLGISDADMEKGHMRCEANISLGSLNPQEELQLGTKVEVKNLNSFKSVEKAILFELERQEKILTSGEGKIIQETRGWDENKQVTVSQRIKETSADYRYFPEPDLPPMRFVVDLENQTDDSSKINIRSIQAHLPELPRAKRLRFEEEYLLETSTAEVLTVDKDISQYAESVFTELATWIQDLSAGGKLPKDEWNQHKGKIIQTAAGWIISKLYKLLDDKKMSITECTISPENFAEMISMLHTGTINSSAGQKILEKMFTDGGDPSHVMEDLNLKQVDNEDEILMFVDDIIAQFPDQVAEYKSGKIAVLQFLLGKIMAASKGKANPQVAKDLLEKRVQ